MPKLKLLAFCLMLQLTAFTQSTKPGSKDSSTHSAALKVPFGDLGAEKLFNQVVSMYDNCQAQNAVLSAQVNNCSQYQEQTQFTLETTNLLLKQKDRQISDADSIAGIREQEVTNLARAMKDTKKIATRKTLGWAFGGLVVGVTVPSLIYLLKH